MRILIAGSSGRGIESSSIDQHIYARAIYYIQKIIYDIMLSESIPLNAITVIGNGDTWVNHIPINLYLNNTVGNLCLFLPSFWNMIKTQYIEQGKPNDVGQRFNKFHVEFSNKAHILSLSDIHKCLEKGVHVVPFYTWKEYVQSLIVGHAISGQASPDLFITVTANVTVPLPGSLSRHIWENIKCKKIHINLKEL